MRFLFGDCVLNSDRRELVRDGQAVHVEPQVFDLLLHLLQNRSSVVTKSDLLSAVWQGRIVSESTLSSRINAARSAIGDSGAKQCFIRTVARKGLRFVGEVSLDSLEPESRVDAGQIDSDRRPAIVVLPFVNLSDDPAQSYLSDGITEDIITDLSRWRRLAVRSRSASFRYRRGDADHQRIARELNVRYIVEGSVRRLGERIRITAQLIDTGTSSQLWAERFDRGMAEIFRVQDDVVETIVGTLVGRVMAADAERSRRRPPASPAAYECVLEGNALPWGDPQGAARATQLFAKAIQIDPDYGMAYAMLAVMRYRAWLGDLSGSNDALNEAFRLATRAVTLAGDESTCYSILSQACLYRRSFEHALQHMQRALEINATNQWNTADMGEVLCYLGRAPEALVWFKRARQIDPYFDPPWYWYGQGLVHMILGDYAAAVAAFERAPQHPFYVSAYLAGCHSKLGDRSRASLLAAACLNEKTDFTIGRWMPKEPFKSVADQTRLAECLRAAGLPE